MLIVARVCAEFRRKDRSVIYTIRPNELLCFLEVPDEVAEDPYFQVLMADGSIDAPVTKAEIKRLEDNPRKSLKMYQDSAEKTSEKRASGAAKAEKKGKAQEKGNAEAVPAAEELTGSNPE